MLFRKVSIIVAILLFSSNLYAISLEELINSALEHNPDIVSAQNAYDNALLSSKTLNGVLSPSVNVSSSATLPKNYGWNQTPDGFSSNITVSQPLPGGAIISTSGTYSFNTTTINEERFLLQSPNISFSLTQSLFPFWMQGKVKDPSILSMQLQKNYFYNQLLYTKKTVLQNLIQQYIYMLVFKNEIKMHQNSIAHLDERLIALKQLKDSGNTNQSEILEMKNSKWTYQQNLMSAFSSHESYVQNLKTISGCNFDDCESNLLNEKDITDLITNSLENVMDPLEEIYKLKLEILDANRTLEKQNSAPTLTLSVQPLWTMEAAKEKEWNQPWKELGSPSAWTASVNVDLSPLISSLEKKNNKVFKNDYTAAEKSYSSYLAQKEFVHQQYKYLIDQYENQLNTVSELLIEEIKELEDYTLQFSSGAVSKLDYESISTRVENCKLTKSSIELYVWLYKTLMLMN
ncbi:MAG TPA: TolC family protein [Treponemataceae bacterium]|nr:TolC family protein [Treponemataceae bacterium]HQL05205.1 TolC family protein [Treponemataceae bacterium]